MVGSFGNLFSGDGVLILLILLLLYGAGYLPQLAELFKRERQYHAPHENSSMDLGTILGWIGAALLFIYLSYLFTR